MKQEQQTQPRIINRPQLEKQVCPSAAAFPQPGVFFLKLTEGSEQPRSTRAGSVSGDRSREMGKREPTFVEQKMWRNAVGADGRLLPGQAGCCKSSRFQAVCAGLTRCWSSWAIPTTALSFGTSPGFLHFVSRQQFLSERRSCCCRSCYSIPRCISFGRGIRVTQLFILLFKMTNIRGLKRSLWLG